MDPEHSISPLSGNIEVWINKTQWIVLRANNAKLLGAVYNTFNAYSLPIPVRSFYETNSTVQESTVETWILEWIDGKYRQCRIRALSNPTHYWRFVKLAGTNRDQLVLDTFPHLDETGDRCLKHNDTVLKPGIFYVAIVETRISIQHVSSEQWLSVGDPKNGHIVGQEDWNESCSFYVGMKSAIYYNDRTNLRRYLSTNSLLFGNRIVNDTWFVRRKQTFYIYAMNDHLLIYSCTSNKFLCIDEQHRLVANAPDIQYACKFRLDGGEPWWDMYCSLTPDGDCFVRLFQWTDNNIYTINEIFDKNPVDVERFRSQSVYQFLILPENGLELYNNDQCLAPSEQMKRERGLVFGISTDKALGNLESEAMIFFQQGMDYISNYIKSEGLFRISGNLQSVKALKNQLNVGTALPNAMMLLETESISVNIDDVCSVFKLFFRHMRPPLIGDDTFALFIKDASIDDAQGEIHTVTCGKECIQYTTEQFNRYKTIINRNMPKPRRSVLARLCKFLWEIAQHSEENMMTPSNLAIVIAPNLISPNVSSPVLWRFVFSILVAEQEKIFALPAIKPPSGSLHSTY